MKKILLLVFGLILPVIMVACGGVNSKKDIELMGAGDRIHDSFTFANLGVEIKEEKKDVYTISGSVERLEDANVKQEFKIDEDVYNVVAVKLSSNGKEVDKDKLTIKVDGARNYDAEHFNGSDHTFIILEAVKGKSVSITVSWNGVDNYNYVIMFDENLILK